MLDAPVIAILICQEDTFYKEDIHIICQNIFYRLKILKI